MDTVLLKFIVLFASVLNANGLAIKKTTTDLTNYYEIDSLTTDDDTPIIELLKNTAQDREISYITLIPKGVQDNKLWIENYFIIKSKLKLIDVDPQVLFNSPKKTNSHLIVMWLNLYCDMHPNCDKEKLNEELNQVRPYLKL